MSLVDQMVSPMPEPCHELERIVRNEEILKTLRVEMSAMNAKLDTVLDLVSRNRGFVSGAITSVSLILASVVAAPKLFISVIHFFS